LPNIVPLPGPAGKYFHPDTKKNVLALVAVPAAGHPLALVFAPLSPGDADAAVEEWRAAARWWAEDRDVPEKERLWSAFQQHFDPVPLILQVNTRTWGEPA
jgi:hypothetical protein